MSIDVAWKEFNIHGKSDNLDENEEAGDTNFISHLFDNPDDDPYETKEYTFAKLPTEDKTIHLRGQSDIQVSTGLAVWLGSEVLCEYLTNYPNLVKDKKVLEFGAGVGLCGIASHLMGAARVLMTDGDTDVLDNLRHNVNLNIKTSGDEEKSSVSCPQLVWGTGRNAYFFQEAYGTSDVLIATDCVYMTQSLEPLWQSVNELLEPVGGIFLYVNRCAQQVSIELVLKHATSYGFTWAEPTEDGVYTFTRLAKRNVDELQEGSES
uniref:Calmodulin-lysine N-methyltransferase n=1 Tax=Chaetoceros debilis TaxID=122233 RepID=A0A7S3Q159_9STRA